MRVTDKTRIRFCLSSALMLCLLLAVGGLSAWLSTRYPIRYDWTHAGRHTLSQPSVDLLAQMPDPIEVRSYARESPALRRAIRGFIRRYQRHKDNIQLHFVNPDAVPDEVRSLGVRVDGELVVRYQGHKEHVQRNSEQDFTNALQRLGRKQDRWLVFVEGHGERSALGEANHDLNEWVRQLNSRGFKVQPINLPHTPVIPDNTSVLVIAGPKIDFLPGEMDSIDEYVDGGGNLLWLADPGGVYGLDRLAERLGIGFYAGTIIDSAGRLVGIDNPAMTLVTRSLYHPHPVTEDFSLTTLFPHAAGIRIDGQTDWLIKPVFGSGDHTWSETGELSGEVDLDEDEAAGPFVLGVSMEREAEAGRRQRVVVIGDGDFLSNTYLGNGGNLDLGIRIINWLGSDDAFIAIGAKTAVDTQIDLSGTTLGIVGLVFLALLPAGLLVAGFAVSVRRRRL